MDRTIPVSELRKNLRNVFDAVCKNHDVLLATRPGGNVVVMSEEDYLELNETAYLLNSKTNRDRLKKAMKSKGVVYNNLSEMEEALGI